MRAGSPILDHHPVRPNPGHFVHSDVGFDSQLSSHCSSEKFVVGNAVVEGLPNPLASAPAVAADSEQASRACRLPSHQHPDVEAAARTFGWLNDLANKAAAFVRMTVVLVLSFVAHP